jgi:Arc/MetJ family transcription regulator
MAQITIADELLTQVRRALPEFASTDEFVEEAVREKLAVQQRRVEFFRLSEETRRRMEEKGISESEILNDFELFRQGLTLD